MQYLSQQERKTKIIKQVSIWIGGIIIVAGAVWGVAELARSSKSQSQGNSIPSVSASDHTLGAANPKVTIVEYADFQCPYCAAANPNLEQLVKDYPDQVLFVYRNFPLLGTHQDTAIATAAAEAAALQGKFWQMHDLLFANQSQWADQPKAQDLFVSYASSLGLNVDQFKTDMSSSAIQSEVKADYDEALNLHLDHTPTLFVNGKETDIPTTYDGYKQMVEEAIAR